MAQHNNPGVGGRGKRAPYNTTHYRIPEILKPLVEKMAANYRELVTEYDDPNDTGLVKAVLSTITHGTSSPAAIAFTTQVTQLQHKISSLHQQLSELEILKNQLTKELQQKADELTEIKIENAQLKEQLQRFQSKTSLVKKTKSSSKSQQSKCPNCESTKVIKYGRKSGRQNYRCNNCQRQFLKFEN